ncbi:MAG: hypothetical protein D6677_02710 [Calditrichaeota bacterium]|nr:MAG: hypothetical protein D6677_02710 [Calditrichota bacterium]
MRKGFWIALVMLTLPLTMQAQDAHFGAGSMVVGGNIDLSALQLGYGGSFEYGITNSIGIKPGIVIHNYDLGTQTWSFTVIDGWATYHFSGGGFLSFMDPKKLDNYAMLGVTFASFGVSGGTGNEETSSSFGFGGGAGSRYYFNDKLSFSAEGKYRLATFKTDTYSLAIGWYTISVGVSYAIN